MRTAQQAGFAGATFYLLAGLIVWAARFLGVYIFTAVACARGAAELVPPVMVGAALLGSAICVALIVYALRSLRTGTAENFRFFHIIAALVAAISILAMGWETVPALIIPVCPA
jgi:hypothetical protein